MADGDHCGRQGAPHFVYQFRNGIGQVLYIGMTVDLGPRLRSHSKRQRWWPEVADVRADRHADHGSARSAEVSSIATLGPLYNVRDSPEPPLNARWVVPLNRRRETRAARDPESLLDYQSMGEWLNMSPRTLRHYRHLGKLPDPDFRIGNRNMWRAATIATWDDARRALWVVPA